MNNAGGGGGQRIHKQSIGKRLIAVFSLAVIAVTASSLIVHAPARVGQNSVRLGIVVYLCWLILAGSNTARWITVCLLFWGVMLGIADMVVPNNLTAVDMVLTGVSVLAYGGFAAALLFSPAVQSHMAGRQPKRDNPN